MVPLKDCHRCKRVLPLGFFGRARTRVDGTVCPESRCRECKNELQKEWLERQDPDKLRLKLRKARRERLLSRTPEEVRRDKAAARERNRRRYYENGGRERSLARARERTPEQRERQNMLRRGRRARMKTYDPEAYQAALERQREYENDWRRRQRDEKAKIRMDRLPVGPFVGWLDEQLAAAEREQRNAMYVGEGNQGSSGREATLEGLGIIPRSYSAWKNGERKTVHVKTIDKALTIAGEPWLLGELYPELD